MKQSIFKQSFNVKGKIHEIDGSIVVTMNYKSNVMCVRHLIETFIENTKLNSSTFSTEKDVLKELSLSIKRFTELLDYMANKEQEKSFIDQMEELGFKSKR